MIPKLISITLHSPLTVTCNVGDWVEVNSDYSPGHCSEGGTGVIVATSEGNNKFELTQHT